MNRIICVAGANDETIPAGGRGVRRGRPGRRRRPVRDPAGDDRRRVRAGKGRRRHHGPQSGAGSRDRGRGHRGHRLARPQRARVRADRRRGARRRRGCRGRRPARARGAPAHLARRDARGAGRGRPSARRAGHESRIAPGPRDRHDRSRRRVRRGVRRRARPGVGRGRRRAAGLRIRGGQRDPAGYAIVVRGARCRCSDAGPDCNATVDVGRRPADATLWPS